MAQPVDRLATFIMAGLCLLWGSQQVLIKVTSESIPPLLQVGLRSGVAVLLILSMFVWRRCPISLAGRAWRPGIIVGLLFGVEYLLICIGLRYTSAARMVTFIYSAPLFAAIGLHWTVQAQRLRKGQWIGMAFAFSGIVIAFMDRSPVEGAHRLLGDACGVAAGSLWGLVTVLLRTTRLADAPAIESLTYQLAGGCVVASAGAVFMGDTQITMSGFALLSLGVQTVFIALASFFVWMWLLGQYSAAQLGTLTFMTPLFGVLFGRFFLKEAVGPFFVVGGAGVLLGIYLVNYRKLQDA